MLNRKHRKTGGIYDNYAIVVRGKPMKVKEIRLSVLNPSAPPVVIVRAK